MVWGLNGRGSKRSAKSFLFWVCGNLLPDKIERLVDSGVGMKKMPYSYQIASNQNSPKFQFADAFTITITNIDDGSVEVFNRIVSKVGKQVSFRNHLNEFICSRKPIAIAGNVQGIHLPFHLITGATFNLWVYSGPVPDDPTITAPTARQERIREAEEAVARTEERVREAQEALEMAIEMERVEEARIEEARAIIRPPAPTIPAHFLAEFMEMSLQLKRGHSCPCCFDVVTKETIYASPCGHILCKDCHKGVMGTSKLCPTCRQEL